MGKCAVQGATVRGVEAVPVEVEVSVDNGVPGFAIVGMADASVQESRERVKAALKSCGFTMPASKIVVNLAPGSLRKTGSGFDLPIALGILCASGQIDPKAAERCLVVGELSLEGSVRPVAGLLAYALCARRVGCALVSAASSDLACVDDVERLEARTLADFRALPLPPLRMAPPAHARLEPDFCDIAGHETAKRALQVAAAGAHGVLMMGPPGSGKTMLASRLPSILPDLTRAERLEAAVVHSVAGEPIAPLLAGVRPFRGPHHSATLAGLVGGGSPPRPGEVSLAHHGVLFLDEMAEFTPAVLQSIRQPIESGHVVVTRADGSVEFPARFMLVAAANPCPCGHYGCDDAPCTCTVPQIRKYQARIGGPVLDRIDLHVDVQRIPPENVLATGKGTSSAVLKEGVERARAFAAWRRERQGGGSLLDAEALVRSCGLAAEDQAYLEDAAESMRMSGRGIMRVLSVARTIADMEERERVARSHLCEALGYRLRAGETL